MKGRVFTGNSNVESRSTPICTADASATRRTLSRIRSLAIPPAWTDVWISPRANSHLQVTGRDAKGRKQYRYHPDWRAQRDSNKYSHVIAFAKALPRIRRRVNHDLATRGLTKPKVVAAIVRLLETSLIRVGNEEYARNNHSFGLTTMRDHHADVNGSTIRFRFRGKSGVNGTWSFAIPGWRESSVVARTCPDKSCFSISMRPERSMTSDRRTSTTISRGLRPGHYGERLSDLGRNGVTAQALQEFESFDSQARAKKNILRAIESVASRLGNTPSVCKKCYIHPAVFDAYLDRSLATVVQKRTEADLRGGLRSYFSEEAAVLTLLQQRLKAQGTLVAAR